LRAASAKLLTVCCALLLTGTLSHAQAGKTAKKSSTTHKTFSKSKSKKSRKTVSKRGQQKIDSERTRQIQEALIHEHYMDGEPSGTWDAATQKAMERYQTDNGWQTKTLPDSRALIKLGLGPDTGHLLNPETAMTTPPATPHPAADPAAVKPPQ